MTYEKFYCSLNVAFNKELEEAELFIENLEHNLKKFISLSTKLNSKYINDKSKNGSNVKYIPEKITLSSPLTLFEGPKFSGKTTFMEFVCKNILDNKIQLSYINKVKIINLLNYFPCFQPDVFFNLFINDALDILDNNETKKSLLKYLSTSSEKNDTYKLNVNLDTIAKINKQINKPILFIIDNIEKIDSNLEAVLQAVNKLSVISNFAFLFIVNGNFNKFTTNYSNEKEKSISKSYKKLESFVNLPIYKFNQDYTCLLNKYDLDSSLIKNFNDMLIKNDDYLISLKELDVFLTNIVQDNNHLDKYKFLNSLYNMFPNAEKYISQIIVENNKLFSKGLEDLRKLKEYNLQTSMDLLEKYSCLDNLIEMDSDEEYYWENSKIKYDLERKFEDICSKYYDDIKWIKYKEDLLVIDKTIVTLIEDISAEIKSNEKRISTNKVLKSKRNKISNENLYSPTFSDFDETNYEMTSSENLIDELAIGDPDEINDIKQKIAEDNVALNNLYFIKKNLDAYFSNIESKIKNLQNKIKQFLANKDFKDDISVLNEIFLDSKFKSKLLEKSSSYEDLLKFKSLEDILKDDDFKFFDELISFVNDKMRFYIMENYNKPN